MSGTSHNAVIRTLVDDAAVNGIRLWVEDGQLHYKAPRGNIPPTLRAALQSRKEELIGELSQPVFRKRGRAPDLLRYPPFWRDFWDETQNNLAIANSTHFVLELVGNIDLERIESALTQLISRYEILRSSVRLVDGVPCLLLEQHRAAPIDIVDLSARAVADPAVDSLVYQTIYSPFEDSVIYRVRVIKIVDQNYRIAFVISHFVADAVSCATLAGELVTLLQETHSPQQAVEPPLQYSDYLLAMNDWLSGEGARYRLAYWKQKMCAAPAVRFPRTRDTPANGPALLDSVSIRISAALRANLVRTAANFRVPIAIVFLAAKFAALMSTLKSHDLIVIMVHSGRDDPALIKLVGFTVNCFPVRVSIVPTMSYGDLLTSVNETYVLARDYQVPWALLMRSLAELGVDCAAPIFNYLAEQRDETLRSPSSRPGGDLEVDYIAVEGPPPTNSVDWKTHSFNIVDYGDEALVAVHYEQLKYSVACVNEFTEAFLLCLEAMAADPKRQIGMGHT